MRIYAALLLVLAGCSPSGLLSWQDHSGPCAEDACSPEGLNISGVVELDAASLDDSILCTVCRNGTCLPPVIAPSNGTGRESGGVTCRENAQQVGDACWGVKVDKAGACFLIMVSNSAFTLQDTDVYTVTIDGHATGTRYVDLQKLSTQYADYHPTVCHDPQNVTCHGAVVRFSTGPGGLTIDGGSLVDAGAD